ncbi:MAG TPA: hypothetical protein VMC79_13085 [Rectinemataceae bacterium]|nr:hypothetical protein [Rectinemataceae bacterium]
MKSVSLYVALAVAILIAPSALGESFSPTPVRAPEVTSLPLHLKIAGMNSAEAPQVIEDRLVLSVSGPYRFVGAAFAHEGFAVIHQFDINPQGIFVLALPIPLKRSQPLIYRLIIDGVWTSDPSNPRVVNDPATGTALSIVDVPYLSDLHLGLYRVLDPDGRTAHFLFQAAPGQIVTVCGDFDNWDPFIHEMPEVKPGLYELDLPLSPGTHFYGFVYRGDVVPDPLNGLKASNRDGKIVSVLTVPD